MPSVCFVCLGNICRSPTAEGVMLHLTKTHGLEDSLFVDSAGTSAHHVGEAADSRSREVALEQGYELTSSSRQVTAADFSRFDLLVAMDRSNLHHLRRIAPPHLQEKAVLFRNFDPLSPEESDVPDPYYGGEHGFLNVLTLCERGCLGILSHFFPDRI
jgi:protein-tyrosine phosphatase